MATAPLPLLDVAQVAERLNRRVRGVYLLAERGQIEHIKVGRLLRFRPEAVERYIAEHTHPADEGRPS